MKNKKPPFEITNQIIDYVAEIAELVGRMTASSPLSTSPMFAGRINTFKYNTGFQSVEEEIDFLERICAIEDYFHIQMTLDGDISEEEYDTVVWVSKLITQDEVESKWSEATCTGILDQRFREKLVELDCEIHTFSYVGNIVVNLFGATFEFRHMRTYKCAIIQDFEKIKRKADRKELRKSRERSCSKRRKTEGVISPTSFPGPHAAVPQTAPDEN